MGTKLDYREEGARSQGKQVYSKATETIDSSYMLELSVARHKYKIK